MRIIFLAPRRGRGSNLFWVFMKRKSPAVMRGPFIKKLAPKVLINQNNENMSKYCQIWYFAYKKLI